MLGEFHCQIRPPGREDEPTPGIVQDTNGLVVRRYPEQPGTSYCMVECPSGLGDHPSHAISRQVDFFTGRRERVEWKAYSYDEPADLADRLALAGFVAESPETLLLGEVSGLIHDVDLPPGVRVRAVTSDADLTRIDELMKSISAPDREEGSLAQEMQANPDALDVVVVEESAGGPDACCPAGCATPPVRTLPACGAVRRFPSGDTRACIAPPSLTGPGSLASEVTGSCGWTPRPTRGRSWCASGCARWPPSHRSFSTRAKHQADRVSSTSGLTAGTDRGFLGGVMPAFGGPAPARRPLAARRWPAAPRECGGASSSDFATAVNPEA